MKLPKLASQTALRSMVLFLWATCGIAPAYIPAYAAKNDYYLQNNSMIFAVIGDYGLAGQAEADVAALVKGWNPEFIITVGDNNYPKGTPDTIDQNIGQYYHEYIFPYKGNFGGGSTYKRFFPALGNHDWDNNGAKPYYDFFSFFNNRGYYDFTQGSVHFFIIDSDPREPDGVSPTSKQGKWLKDALVNSTSQFNLVFMHHPPYSSGDHGSNSYMQWPFKEWGADAVFAGHDHIYERIFVNDLPYFVNGLGGGEIYSFGTILSSSQARFNQDFGAMRMEATNTSIRFQFYTRTGNLVDEYTIGGSTPTVTSINRANASPSNANTVDFNVTFSEPVSGVDASDFILNSNLINGASISAVNGSGANYIVSAFTGSGDGAISLNLIDNDSIVNAINNPLGGLGYGNANYSASDGYTIDKTNPNVISIIRSNASPTNSVIVHYTVIFSEPVNGVDISDFKLTTTNFGGESIAAISGFGTNYDLTVNTSPGNDTLRLDLVDNDTITDAAGNLLSGYGTNDFITGESYLIDRAAPVILSIVRAGNNPTNLSAVDFLVTFSEPVIGVDISDFNLNTANFGGANISSVNGSDSVYKVSANTAPGNDILRLDAIDNDSIFDLAGNPLGEIGAGNGSFSSGESYTVDRNPPFVLNITRAGPDPSTESIVNFTVAFSEPVTGVDIKDFILIAASPGNISIVNVNGYDAIYNISVNTGTGNNSLRLDLIDDDSVIDMAGNKLGLEGAGNGNFNTGEVFTIYKTVPNVLSITRANSNPSNASSVAFTVTFSEAVTGVDAADFVIDSRAGANIGNISGAGSVYTTTIFTGPGDDVIRLDVIDNDSVISGSAARLGGSGTGNGNFTSGESYLIDKSNPSILSIVQSSATPTNSVSVGYTVYFSEPVLDVDGSDFKLSTNGLPGAFIQNVNGSDSVYQISISTGSGSGTIRLDSINDQSIVDGAGNPLINTISSETSTISKASVDFPAPSLRAPLKDFITNNPQPNIAWAAVRKAQNYEIMIAQDEFFSQITISQIVNGLAFSPDLPLNDGKYYWRVRAYNPEFQPGKFSETRSFVIDTSPPPAPVLTSPTNNTTTSKRLMFEWLKVDSAVIYHIEVDNNPDFSSPEWSSWRKETLFQITAARKQTYFWRVNAKDMAGNWSAWSDVFTIRIP